MTEPDDQLVPLPDLVPMAFAELLGYRGNRRFVAVHWEPLGDEVIVRDDRSVATGIGDHYVWSDFCHQRRIRAWLWDQNINLGNSDEVATHWLFIDRLTNTGFIASRDHGYRVVQQQRLTTIE